MAEWIEKGNKETRKEKQMTCAWKPHASFVKNILCLRGCCCGRRRGSICVCGTLPLAGTPGPTAWGAIKPIGRVIIPRTGGRPSQELAGDHPKNWRATIPRTGRRPSQELAGGHPRNWRATNPRNGGRPTQGMAGDQTKKWRATNPRNYFALYGLPNGPDSQAASQPDRNQAT